MTRLKDFFEKDQHRIIDKWIHYFEIYERHLSRYIGEKVTILEIGVSHGGSLQMWKDYFGDGSVIYGVDINPECKKFEEPGIQVFIGSQSDRSFLRKLIKQIPRPDILIDDGGHMMNQQIITFEELYDHVKDNGIYLCEDLHTSYWLTHGGGVRRHGTFIEFSKRLIDSINAWHSKQKYFKMDKYTRSVYGLHFYDSVLVIEKGIINKPFSMRKGISSITEDLSSVGKRTPLKLAGNYFDSLMARLRIAKKFHEM